MPRPLSVITIDPTKLISPCADEGGKEASRLLALALSHQQDVLGKGHPVFHPNIRYNLNKIRAKVPLKNLPPKLQLTHRIIYAPKISRYSGKIIPRYYVGGGLMTNDKNGHKRGNYGTLYDVIGKLSYNHNNELIYQAYPQKKMKAVKFMVTGPGLSVEEVKREAALLRLTDHAHAKAIILDDPANNHHYEAYLLMKKFPGIPFSVLIKKIRDGTYKFSVDQLIQLSINLLVALKEQIHAKGIIHRDIKPENIIVNPTTLKVKITDLGLSIKSAENNNDLCGSPGFMAPEVILLRPPLDETSDGYSAGLVMALLWNAIDRVAEYEKNAGTINWDFNKFTAYVRRKIFSRDKSNLSFETFPHLFEDIPNLSPHDDTAKKIRYVLTNLTAFETKNRLKLDAAILALESLQLERKLEKIKDNSTKKNVRNAHLVAVMLRNEFKNSSWKKSSDVLLDLKNTIIIATVKVAESKEAIREFVETSRIKAFAGLTDTASISKKINTIIADFIEHTNALLMTLETLEKYASVSPLFRHSKIAKDIEVLTEETGRLLLKRRKRTVTVDNLVALNKRFSARLPDIEKNIAKLRAEINEPKDKTVTSYLALIDRLKISKKTARNTRLESLVKGIKRAIKNYIDSTLTTANVGKADRAASQTRYANMVDILDIIDKHEKDADANALIREVNSTLSIIETGFFGRSKLRSNIQRAISECAVKPKASRVCG